MIILFCAICTIRSVLLEILDWWKWVGCSGESNTNTNCIQINTFKNTNNLNQLRPFGSRQLQHPPLFLRSDGWVGGSGDPNTNTNCLNPNLHSFWVFHNHPKAGNDRGAFCNLTYCCTKWVLGTHRFITKKELKDCVQEIFNLDSPQNLAGDCPRSEYQGNR